MRLTLALPAMNPTWTTSWTSKLTGAANARVGRSRGWGCRGVDCNMEGPGWVQQLGVGACRHARVGAHPGLVHRAGLY